ncbi:MAG: hypothetical protein Kow0079_07650 [Vicingaceae bacterium]
MKKSKFLITGILIAFGMKAQDTSQVKLNYTQQPVNSAQRIINGDFDGKVRIGAYAQVDYNQPFNDTAYANGNLDVHRFVTFMGYKFNQKVHFVSEIEFEHVKEVYIEQAFLNYRIKPWLNFRGGLMLIPMGIINEYHEPTTYYGVERPNIDGKIVPTTWRELGAGFMGNIDKYGIRYQLYAVNGFKSFDGSGTLRGSDGFRKGRQKGAESIMSSPNFSGKVDYYGINGLKIGVAGYFGNTQSTAYNGLPKDSTDWIKQADSTVVGLSMIGFDVRYTYKFFNLRGQYILANISNAAAYNKYTGKDIGSSMNGYYAEIGIDVLNLINKDAKEKLILSGRYEFYDTQATVPADMIKNDAYARTDYTFGINYFVAPGAVIKGDYQIFQTEAKGSEPSSQLNFGIGIWF